MGVWSTGEPEDEAAEAFTDAQEQAIINLQELFNAIPPHEHARHLDAYTDVATWIKTQQPPRAAADFPVGFLIGDGHRGRVIGIRLQAEQRSEYRQEEEDSEQEDTPEEGKSVAGPWGPPEPETYTQFTAAETVATAINTALEQGEDSLEAARRLA